MYPVRQIVNAILLRAHESGHPITPLRVQKIFFFMWLQAKKGGIILLNESPRKFPFGPIFDSLYFELRIFKGSPIDTLIHPQSKLGRRLPGISHLISWIFKHRGATHSLAFAILIGALAVLYSKPLALGLVLGLLTHVACDSLTDGGIPILWPWKKRFGWRIIRTGGLAEWLINIAGVIGCWMLVSGGSFDVARLVGNLLKNI